MTTLQEHVGDIAAIVWQWSVMHESVGMDYEHRGAASLLIVSEVTFGLQSKSRVGHSEPPQGASYAQRVSPVGM